MTAFAATFVDGAVVATVKEKQVAVAQYNAAVSNGQQAAILQHSKTATAFEMKLCNLAAGERVTVKLTVITTLSTQSDGSGHICAKLPLSFGDPAFKKSIVPAVSASEAPLIPQVLASAEPGSAENAPHELAAPFFNMCMAVACASAITSIMAPTLEEHVRIVSVVPDPNYSNTGLDASHPEHPDKYRIVCMQASQAPTCDIELVIAQRDPYALAANVEIDVRTATAASLASIRLPPLNEITDSVEGLPLELIFLADVSGALVIIQDRSMVCKCYSLFQAQLLNEKYSAPFIVSHIVINRYSSVISLHCFRFDGRTGHPALETSFACFFARLAEHVSL